MPLTPECRDPLTPPCQEAVLPLPSGGVVRYYGPRRLSREDAERLHRLIDLLLTADAGGGGGGPDA